MRDRESARVASLRACGVRVGPPDPLFDDLAALAARLCDAPIALVNLVDEARTRSRAAVGVPLVDENRENTFCHWAVSGRDLLEVPDLSVDERFRDHPLVTGAGLRFYAGQPLLDPDGLALGTLCLLDIRRRRLDDQQRADLASLARQASALLEQHRQRLQLEQTLAARRTAQQQLADREQQYRLLAENASDIVSRHGPDGSTRWVSPSVRTVLGYDPQLEIGHPPLDRTHPADRDKIRAALRQVELLGAAEVTIRQQDAAGQWRWMEIAVTGLHDEAGALYEVHSRAKDVTERVVAEQTLRASEARLRALFDGGPVPQAEYDLDGRMVAVNDALAALLGYPAQDLVGRCLSEFTHAADCDAQRADMAALCAGHGEGYQAERVLLGRGGALLDVVVTTKLLRDDDDQPQRMIGLVQDVTARVAAQRLADAATQELADRKSFLDAVLDSMDVGVVACDADGHLTLFNSTTRALHGADHDPHLEPREWSATYQLLDDDGVTPLAPERVPLYRALTEGQVHDAEIVIDSPDREPVRVVAHGRALRRDDGSPLGAVVAMHDVTALRAGQRSLQASEERFRLAFHAGPVGLAVADEDGQLVDVNPALCRLLGRPPEDLLGRRLQDFVVEDPAESAPSTDLPPGRVPAQPAAAVERRLHRADGGVVVGRLSVTTLRDVQERQQLLLQVEDVTERKAAEQALTHQALHDGLTGLPNRTSLLDRIEHACARQARTGTTTAVLFIDLDGFKLINDALGHEAGDEVLIEVSRRLLAAVRPSDTVARLGGDEFVLVCEDLGSPSEGEQIARRIERELEAPIPYDGDELFVSASIGVSFTGSQDEASETIRQADLAMYRAKQAGKRRYAVYDAGLRALAGQRQRVDHLLATALSESRVVVHFQPVLTVATGEVTAVEALVRLRQDDGSLVMPDAFIGLAEQNGQIETLGAEVLRIAVNQAAAWRAESGRDITVSVNVSPRQLSDPALVDRVLATIDGAGLPPHLLALELTESALLQADSGTHEALRRLRAAGVHLGLDDFGTGWASLTYLHDLPVSFIKIDRTFVRRLPDDRTAAAIIAAVSSLSRELRLVCIAEGVETLEEHAALLGQVDLVQGYLLGRPVDPAELHFGVPLDAPLDIPGPRRDRGLVSVPSD